MKFKYYITREKNGDLYIWVEKPKKHPLDGWMRDVSVKNPHRVHKPSYKIDNSLYPKVKWENDQPFEVKLDCDEFMDLTLLK